MKYNVPYGLSDRDDALRHALRQRQSCDRRTMGSIPPAASIEVSDQREIVAVIQYASTTRG